MIIQERGSVLKLLAWQWKLCLMLALGALIPIVLVKFLDVDATDITLPTLPLTVVGAALGIFVSFRTNSAYDRWWEGRKLWGRLINVSRHLSTQIMCYAGAKARPVPEQVVRRHIAYVHTLRCLLRKQDPFTDENVVAYLTAEERRTMTGETNLTHALLHRQMATVVQLSHDGHLDAMQVASLDESIRVLLDVQGGCERIKKTPLPRGYGFIAGWLIKAYGFLFPLAVVGQLGWLTIPANMLVGLGFGLISEAGRVLEDPFTLYWNGLPLSDMSRTIERNLLQRLDEVPELPPAQVPQPEGVLM
ncbi:MAG: bestrophin family protein [Bradymonadia bacterium]